MLLKSNCVISNAQFMNAKDRFLVNLTFKELQSTCLIPLPVLFQVTIATMIGHPSSSFLFCSVDFTLALITAMQTLHL